MSDFDKINEYIGNTLRTVREEKGFTQEALAHSSEVSYDQIGSYERAQGNPTVKSLVRLCDTLGIRLSDLIPQAEDEFSILIAGLSPDKRREIYELVQRVLHISQWEQH